MINIGHYIEVAIEWLAEKGAGFFDVWNVYVEGVIDSFQLVLYAIPFYVFISLTALLAWWKSGKGMGLFTLLGLLLVWGMGFWKETMQTLALVLFSTFAALLIGVPLGIWTEKNERCNRIFRPVLDCMRTMPVFVFLIPAVLFFWVGYGSWRPCHHCLCHVSGDTLYGIGNAAGARACRRGSSGVRRHSPAAIFQGAVAFGLPHCVDWHQSGCHDVPFHGSGVCHDFDWWIG